MVSDAALEAKNVLEGFGYLREVSMKNILRILAFTVVALGLFYAPAAKADTFTLTASSSNGVTVTANMTGTFLSSGEYLINSITSGNVVVPVSVTSLTAGSIAGGLEPNPSSPAGPVFTTANGQFYADDVLFLNAGNFLFDNAGLVFFVGNGCTVGSGCPEFNIYNTTGNNNGQEWLINSGGGGVWLDNFSITDNTTHTSYGTPEPVTLLLFGTGLMGIGGMVRRKLSR
jgi:hypothetical protein